MKILAINNTSNYQNKSFQAQFNRTKSLKDAFTAAEILHSGNNGQKAISESFLLAVKSLLGNGSDEKINIYVDSKSQLLERGEKAMNTVIRAARKREPEFDSLKVGYEGKDMYYKNTVTPEELSIITPELDKLSQIDKTSLDVLEQICRINWKIENKLHKFFVEDLLALKDKIFNK